MLGSGQLESGLCCHAFPSSLTFQVSVAPFPPSMLPVHPRSWLPAPLALLQYRLEDFLKICNYAHKAKLKRHERSSREKSPTPFPATLFPERSPCYRLFKSTFCLWISPHRNRSVCSHVALHLAPLASVTQLRTRASCCALHHN